MKTLVVNMNAAGRFVIMYKIYLFECGEREQKLISTIADAIAEYRQATGLASTGNSDSPDSKKLE
jgi:hypothetical protein